jgi:hypothetical protein
LYDFTEETVNQIFEPVKEKVATSNCQGSAGIKILALYEFHVTLFLF